MRKQFYEKALPTQGIYCATGIKNGKALNRFTRSIDELLAIIDGFVRDEYNVFVALNTFEGFSRKADDAVFARCFFIDLDVGDSPTKYTTKQDALVALGDFVVNTNLPPPVIIDSGTGVHAYWLFEEEIPTYKWVAYAEKFKAFCLEHLHIDPVVTADRSRIMRCPDTFNHKTNPPIPTKFITTDFYQYSFEAFVEFLGETNADPDIKTILAMTEKGLDDDTAGIVKIDPNFETVFEVLAQKSVDDDGGCQQVKYILLNAANLQEPMWRAGLSLARACVDWQTAIHDMSNPYPNYTPEETEKKTEELVNEEGKVMVYDCTTIEKLNPKGCEGCPFRGKITNPLALARRLREPTSPAQNAIREDENPEEVPVYTKYPEDLMPFSRGPNGGIYYKPPAKKDKEGNWVPQKEILLWPHDLYPIKRMYGQMDGECLMMRHILPHDEIRDFLLPMASVYAIDRFKDICTKQGVFFDPEHTQHMSKYIIKWGSYMVSKQGAEQMRAQMGWTSDRNGFVIGNVEIQRSGHVVKTAASPLVNSVAKLLKPAGSYEVWKEAVQRLNKPGYEVHAFPLLCAFGSPLIPYTHIKGVSVGLIGRTGAAKSGALFAGASLFGNPYDLCLAGAKDGATYNALVQWYVGLKNIMMGLDEASNYKAEDISDLLYKVTQGKNKLRSQASVNAVREIELTAGLITVLTSNQSMVDKMSTFKANPDGEMARYVEIYLNKPPTMDGIEGKLMFDAYRENYGHAGPEYIKYLFKIGDDHIKELIDKWERRFIIAIGNDSGFRFYESLIAVSFAGAELAAEAGIINLELDRMFDVIMQQIIAMKVAAAKKADYESMLGEFQVQHQPDTLILNDGRVVSEPKSGRPMARVNVEDKMYYVVKSALEKFLAQRNVPIREFADAMKAKNVLVFDAKQRITNGWEGRNNTNPVALFGFKDLLPPEDIFKNGN